MIENKSPSYFESNPKSVKTNTNSLTLLNFETLRPIETTPIRVSAIVPVLNAEKTIKRAVHSLLIQPEITQIILVEDGSSDGSLQICQELADTYPLILLLRHPNGVNKGAPASRNLGLSHVINPWIQFMDADDELLPGKISDQLQVIRGDECLVVGLFTNMKTKKDPVLPKKDIWIGLLTTRLGNSVANLWKTECVKAAGGWDESLLNVQEYYLMLELLKMNPKVSFSHQNLTLVYAQPNSISNSPKKKNEKLDNYFKFREKVKSYLIELGALTFCRWHYYNFTTGEMMRYHKPSFPVKLNKKHYWIIKKFKALQSQIYARFFSLRSWSKDL